MKYGRRVDQVRLARTYLGLQAMAGALWWVMVFASDRVKEWTLGGWNEAWLAGPDLVLFAGASAVAAWKLSRVAGVVAASWTVGMTVAIVGYALIEQRAGWGAVIMGLAMVGTVASVVTIWFGRLPVAWFFIGPFAFREAGERKPQRHLLRSVMQLIVFWTFFLLVVPLVLSWFEHRIRVDWPALDNTVFNPIGAGLFIAGSMFGVWSCTSMALKGDGTPLPAETATKLVISGPYKIVRNPMAVAGALQTIGVGLWIGSWIAVGSAFAGALLWNSIIRPAEEADLADRFGADYRHYCNAVDCWIPTLRSW